MKELNFVSSNEIETLNVAKEVLSLLKPGDVVTLTGDLGAGKTTFVRGVAKELGINETIQSPTFNIMKIYLNGKLPLIHIDAYRLEDNNVDIGLDEYIGYETGLTFIEWPNNIVNLIPKNCVEIEFKNIDESKRNIKVSVKN